MNSLPRFWRKTELRWSGSEAAENPTQQHKLPTIAPAVIASHQMDRDAALSSMGSL
jgi:hypothetical protein